MKLLERIQEISKSEEKRQLSGEEVGILCKKIDVLVHREAKRNILKADISTTKYSFSEWMIDKIGNRAGVRSAFDNFLKVCVYIYLFNGGIMPDIMKEMKRDYENMLCWKKIDLNSITKDLMY